MRPIIWACYHDAWAAQHEIIHDYHWRSGSVINPSFVQPTVLTLAGGDGFERATVWLRVPRQFVPTGYHTLDRQVLPHHYECVAGESNTTFMVVSRETAARPQDKLLPYRA